MSLYKGNNLISGAMPNSANQSLSNLDSAGQDKFDAKLNNDYSNIKLIGSPILNDHVISGFSTSDYVQLLSPVSLGSNFEICIKATTGSDATSIQQLLAGMTNTYIGLSIQSQGLDFNIGDGTTWLGPTLTPVFLNPNTTYWFKITFNGTRYSGLYSTDGETFTEFGYLDSTTVIPTFPLLLGVSRTIEKPWLGSIDLNASYIKINGSYWWKGVANADNFDNLIPTLGLDTKVNTADIWYDSTSKTLYIGVPQS